MDLLDIKFIFLQFPGTMNNQPLSPLGVAVAPQMRSVMSVQYYQAPAVSPTFELCSYHSIKKTIETHIHKVSLKKKVLKAKPAVKSSLLRSLPGSLRKQSQTSLWNRFEYQQVDLWFRRQCYISLANGPSSFLISTVAKGKKQ